MEDTTGTTDYNMTDNETNTDGTFQPSAPVGTFQQNINAQVGTFQVPPPVVTYQVNPNPPGGAYQYQVNPNPPIGTYQANPPAGTFQAVNPPIVTFPVATVANTQAQSTFQNFNRETTRKLSITLLILGVVTSFLTSWGLNFVGVLPCSFSLFTGVVGIISSRDPSKNKIVAFNILSSVTAVLNVIAIFWNIPLIIAGKVGFLVLAVILHGVIACISGYSAYSSFRQFGWFGSGYGCQDQQSQGGVIHRNDNEAGPHMNNSAPPGQNMQSEGAPPKPHEQSFHYEEAPPKPPSYDEAVKIVD